MILACSNITKSFDGETILNNCSFHLEAKEKAAIVGINGAGKSTILKIIMKELSSDSGEVIIAKDTTIGYLAQYQDLESNNTIYNELMSVKKEVIDLESQMRNLEIKMKSLTGDALESALKSYSNLTHRFELLGGYAYKSEVVGVLKGLGFDETMFDRETSTLSGGQKTRVSLGKLLLAKPDIILLDEPTNHLDIESISWLETYLSNYNGTVLIVAHDRYFLDKIVTKIIEIDHTNVTVFSGSYSDYSVKKAMLRENELKAYYNQQREIKHQEQVIEKLRSFNREKSIKRAESREKMLDKIEVLDKPSGPDKNMKLSLEPRYISGNDVLSVKNLSKSFDHTLFTDLNFEIKRGERIAIIGGNGTGKTTILKIINGLVAADGGQIKIGSNVSIGYYDQEHHVLNTDKTVFDEISDTHPTLTGTEIRNILAAFLFTGDDVFKLIGDLSGGEKGRVSLAKLMLSEANFLILDEPTNHLDINSKEILEDALNNYTGTILYVSHDRFFINKTATRILELKGNVLTEYTGNYDYYLSKRDILAPKEIDKSNEETVSDSKAKVDWKEAKEREAKERKRLNDLKKIEDEIATLEAKIEDYNNELLKEEVYLDPAKCYSIHKEQKILEDRLVILYEKWEENM